MPNSQKGSSMDGYGIMFFHIQNIYLLVNANRDLVY